MLASVCQILKVNFVWLPFDWLFWYLHTYQNLMPLPHFDRHQRNSKIPGSVRFLWPYSYGSDLPNKVISPEVSVLFCGVKVFFMSSVTTALYCFSPFFHLLPETPSLAVLTIRMMAYLGIGSQLSIDFYINNSFRHVESDTERTNDKTTVVPGVNSHQRGIPAPAAPTR